MGLKVGVDRVEYPELRNILFLAEFGVEFVVIPGAPPKHARDAVGAEGEFAPFFDRFAYFPEDCGGVDLFHLFNSVPVVDVPFVTTFETSLPRWWGVNIGTFRKGLEILASDRCLQLFSISRNAIRIFENDINLVAPELHPIIMGKTSVLYPPEVVSVEPETRGVGADENARRLIFVGDDFLRKGGLELLRAFRSALAKGATNLTLDVVSTLQRQGDPNLLWNVDSEARLREANHLLSMLGGNVKFHGRLENKEVLRLFAESDVLMLPSLGDTFGYVVLEAQARGCVAVTTNIRAFPEINDPKRGWLIELPVTKEGKLDQYRHTASSLLVELQVKLETTLLEISRVDVAVLRGKADSALRHLTVANRPAAVAEKIIKSYSKRRVA